VEVEVKKVFLNILFLLFLNDANAITVFLQGDLGTKGTMRYCKYSDGKIYTVDATDLCELSIEASSFGGVGTLVGEKESDGLNKVCVYDVMGERRAIRVSSVSICPLSQNFK
jgi:hypothetical protein